MVYGGYTGPPRCIPTVRLFIPCTEARRLVRIHIYKQQLTQKTDILAKLIDLSGGSNGDGTKSDTNRLKSGQQLKIINFVVGRVSS